MHIQRLKALDLVISTQTVTEAAERLFVTQPQVSRLIAELEAELGFKLFVRSKGRLLPTREGIRFHAEAKRVLMDLDALSGIAQGIRVGRDEKSLSVVATPFVADSVIPKAFSLFSRKYPEIRLFLDIVTRNQFGRWAADYRFDIGISPLPVDVATVRTAPFASMHTAVIIPKAHELSAKSVIPAADLAKYPFIAISAYTLLGQGLKKLFENLGVSLNIRAEIATAMSACEMVARGLGVTIVPGCVGSMLDSRRVELKPWDPGMAFTLGFFYGSRGSSPLVEQFSKMVAATMPEIDPRFTFPLP